jgi:hypothetical protein
MCAPASRPIGASSRVKWSALAASAWLGVCGLGCDRSPQTDAATHAAPAEQQAPTTGTQADPATAQAALEAQTRAAQSWEPSALDDLLAPIALYPDALVGQILSASTNPQEVLDAGNWLLDNQDLKGQELDAATGKLGFGPAVRSLVHFPSVVDMMCSQLDWTKEVGQAFTADQRGVLESIQRLRTQAAAVGNLKSSPQQKVEKKQDAGKEVIVVEPADPKVVYVPQYDPQVVYTTPPPSPAPATTVVQEGHSTGDMVAAGLIGFTAGVILNEAFDDHDDYYYPHWGGGPVYYPPPYRPVYPAYRPATAYVRPAGYRYDYNRVYNDVQRGDVNINIDNDNYFNRATNNHRAVNRGTTDSNEWRGQSTYRGSQAGARDQAGQHANDAGLGSDSVTRANAKRADSDDYRAARDQRRPQSSEYRGATNRDGTVGEYRGSVDREAAAGRLDTVGGDEARGNAERRAADAAGASERRPRADRGFASSDAAPPRAREAQTGSSVAPSGALSNVSRGASEHAASQRGHQSAGGRVRRGR